MPAVIGLPQADAERLLAAGGLHVAKITQVAEAARRKVPSSAKRPRADNA